MAVDREKILQIAQKLVEKKQFAKAIGEYQKILAEDPKDVRVLLRVGDAHLKGNEFVEAITTYETVGQFYSQQGFLPKALAVYKQIRDIVRKHVPHLEDRFGHVVPKLAEIYAQLGHMADALVTYDELAARLQAAGRERDVIDVFRKVSELDPNNPVPLLRLADAYMRVRDVDNAIARLGTAAQLLLKLGRREEALKVVERLLQHRPEPPFCKLAAEIYLERAGPADGMAALTKLQVCFKDNPRDLDTLGLLSRAFDLLGQPAKSLEVMKEAARIAKEAGKLDVFSTLVDALVVRAPRDEGVLALVSQRAAASKAASIAPPSAKLPAHVEARINAADPRASIDVEFDEQEVIDVEAESRPLSLRTPLEARGSSVAAPLDPVLRARQVSAQAEALRRSHRYEDAARLLASAIEDMPDARELREKLCDLLIEAGDQDGAIAAMLAFARRLADTDDIEGAARLLDEVLLLEPGHAEATSMLGELGYAVPGMSYAEVQEGYDPNAPLPSYELDEAPAPLPLPPPAETLGGLDDPFAGDMPLPSFQLEDEATRMYQPGSLYDTDAPFSQGPPRPGPGPLGQEPAWGAGTPALSATGGHAAVQIPQAPPPYIPSAPDIDAATLQGGYGHFDEAALEEVDFFVSQGEYEEAKNLLEEQLSRNPSHPLLIDRKRELDALMRTQHQSGTRAVPKSGYPESPEDRSFDIAASLDALDALDHTGEPAMAMDQQISVESVFEQFKAGVAAQVSESDAATHYDLGVAYKEMGLFTDAIAEFEVASRDPMRECVCQSMIGVIHLQLGNVDAGVHALNRSLLAPQKTRDQELAIMYELGNAYEMGNQLEQALYSFQRLLRMDASYYDPRGAVGDRVRRLDAPKPPPARAVGHDLVSDDFDAAFDELLGGKLP